MLGSKFHPFAVHNNVEVKDASCRNSGVDRSRVAPGLYREVDVVRLADELQGDLELDMWIAPINLKIARRQLPHFRGLRVVQSLMAGVDRLQQLLPPGVTLCDAKGVNDAPTAEWAVAVILAMQKHLPFYFSWQQQEDWGGRRQAAELDHPSQVLPAGLRSPALTDEMEVKTILIVGYGSIGSAIESRLTPFGPRILRVARRAREGVAPVSQLDELLPQADIVVLITPLTPGDHAPYERRQNRQDEARGSFGECSTWPVGGYGRIDPGARSRKDSRRHRCG